MLLIYKYLLLFFFAFLSLSSHPFILFFHSFYVNARLVIWSNKPLWKTKCHLEKKKAPSKCGRRGQVMRAAARCWHGGATQPYVNDGPWAAPLLMSLLSLLRQHHNSSRYKNNGKQLRAISPSETILWQANKKIKPYRITNHCTTQSLNRVIKCYILSFFYYPWLFISI